VDANEQAIALSYLGPLGYIADPEEPDPIVERFGFSLAAVEVRGSLTPEEISEALKNFQARNGLYPTGELDRGTIELFNTPRCGVPDVGEYVLHDRKWPIKDLTYSIWQPAQELFDYEMRQALGEAFGAWSKVVPLTFSEMPAGSPAHITIRFASGDHGCGTSFDSAGGVLAHAYFPTHGGMHFDEAERWTLSTNGIHLPTVAIHEIGHLLGLNHSADRSAIMYAYYGGPNPHLYSDDIAGIQALYGKPSAPTPGPSPPVAPSPGMAWVP
jgi:hypothetical protein